MKLLGLVTIYSQLLRYLSYVARNFSSFYLVVGLTLILLILEYVAISLMIPMSPGQSTANSYVVQIWNRIAASLGMEPIFRTWLWLFFVVMAIRLSVGYIVTVLTTWLGKQVHASLSGKVFGHVLLLEPLEEVYHRSIGYYITLAGDDTFKSGMIVTSVLQTSIGLLSSMVAMVVLYQFSPKVFFGLVIFLLVCLVIISFLIKKMLHVNQQSVDLSRELGTTFVESLNSLRSIRSLHGERFIMNTYAGQIRKYIRMLVELDAIKSGVKSFPPILLLLIAIYILSPGSEVGMIEVSLFAGTVIVIRVFASLGQMMTSASQLLTDARAVKDIDTIVDMASESQPIPDIKTTENINELKLDMVSFGYNSSKKILDEVTFQFEAGNTYAIIGPSGSGKSTLADIMLGLALPNSGKVTVNNSNLSRDIIQSRIILVEQQPKIFSTTIKENLLMGLKIGDDEIYSALEVVMLDSLIRSLEYAHDSKMTYLGENFSGGQRQRLGIARALLHNPDVLILDEATSALDSDTRIQVVKNLRKRMKDGIIIFITHDREITDLADKVLVINDTSGGVDMANLDPE